MSESEAASSRADLEALRALQTAAPELERIENLLDRFNVFEAIGFVGQEVMHSRFLAFLLDPKQSHGLGTLFLKRFLQKVLETTNEVSLPQAFDSADDRSLDQTTVQTEVYTGDGRIDILLLNEGAKWAMIVENKVWTTEHHDQLGRYHRYVKESHPGWQVSGLYLTPFGDTPSHRAYAPFGYAAVCDLLDGILNDREATPSPDVRMAIQHYTDTVRRHIVGDSEIARLCQQIYQRHRRALDLIYESRSLHLEATRRVLVRLIGQSPGLTFNKLYTRPSGEYLSFRVQGWQVPALKGAEGGAYQHCILLFVFHNLPDRLDLHLQLGPGDEETRNRLFRMAHSNPDTFGSVAETLREETKLYLRPVLTTRYYEEATNSDRDREIRRQWDGFLQRDLPRIEAALKKESWIWESVQPDEGQSSKGSRFVWGEGDIEITKRPEHEE